MKPISLLPVGSGDSALVYTGSRVCRLEGRDNIQALRRLMEFNNRFVDEGSLTEILTGSADPDRLRAFVVERARCLVPAKPLGRHASVTFHTDDADLLACADDLFRRPVISFGFAEPAPTPAAPQDAEGSVAVLFLKAYHPDHVERFYQDFARPDVVLVTSYIAADRLCIDAPWIVSLGTPNHFCQRGFFEEVATKWRRRWLRESRRQPEISSAGDRFGSIERGLAAFHLRYALDDMLHGLSEAQFHDHYARNTTVDLTTAEVDHASVAHSAGCNCHRSRR